MLSVRYSSFFRYFNSDSFLAYKFISFAFISVFFLILCLHICHIRISATFHSTFVIQYLPEDDGVPL